MAGGGNNSLGILILVIGLGLVIYLLVGDSVERYARPKVARVQSQAPGWLNWKTLISPGIAIGLALLMSVPLISFYILLIGLLTLWVAYKKAKLAELAKMNKQVARLVFAFRNVYKIQPVVFAALREVLGRMDQPLKDWIDATLQAYRVTSSEQEAFALLRSKSSNHYLNQFLYILEMSGSASEETVIAALDNLAQRLRRYSDLQRETEIELSSITSQTRIIQVIGIAVLFIIAAVPDMRNVYARVLGAQLIYVILVTIAAGTSYLIDWRVSKLRENVL
jgi:hypothetical protein